MILNAATAGFQYRVHILHPDGTISDEEQVKNLFPMQGINHMIDTWLKNTAQVDTWYVGLFRGNYTPSISDVMATFPGLATEATEYVGTDRLTLSLGSTVGGQVTSTPGSLQFEATSNITVYGGFVSSTGGKGSTSGILASAVRFQSPKVLEAGAILNVTAGFVISPA